MHQRARLQLLEAEQRHLAQHLVGGLARVDQLGDLAHPLAHLAVQRLVEEVLFRVGREVNRTLGYPGRLGDLVDRSLLEPPARERARRFHQDAFLLRQFHRD